jgi:hypothetical protein
MSSPKIHTMLGRGSAADADSERHRKQSDRAAAGGVKEVKKVNWVK